MSTLHFRDPDDRLVGPDEIDSRDELETIVIDEMFEQRIITITPDAARCQACGSTECEHVERVERALADYGLTRAGAP